MWSFTWGTQPTDVPKAEKASKENKKKFINIEISSEAGIKILTSSL